MTTVNAMLSGPPLEIPGAHAAFVLRLGPVRSKSNFRRDRHSAGQTWRQLHDWEAGTAVLLRAARPAHWEIGDASRPVADRPVVVAAVVARTTLDAANLSKSLHDAGEGVLYVTDASVRGTAELTERGRVGQNAVVGFAQLPAGATLAQSAAVLAGLVDAVVAAFSGGVDPT